MQFFHIKFQAFLEDLTKTKGLVKFGAQLRAMHYPGLHRVSQLIALLGAAQASSMRGLMSRDGVHQPTEEIVTKVLLDIQEHLERCSFNLTDFQLPIPDATILRNRGSREMRAETSYDVGALQLFLHDNLTKLNADQAQVFHAAMHSVDNSSGHIIGLDAPRGNGKTFLLSTLLAAVRANRKVALATAPSGIAATLLPNGRALHSRCKGFHSTSKMTQHATSQNDTVLQNSFASATRLPSTRSPWPTLSQVCITMS